MPFDNTGTFIRVHNWTEDKSNNIPITASRMDAEDDGFATGLSQTLLRNGSVALTGDLKAGNNKLTGLKNGTADTDAATVAQLNTVQGNAVLLTGDQTVAGTKTFTSSPVVPTVSADDSSTKVATTKWVNTTGNNVVHLTDDETITGTKTFTDRVYTNAEVVYINNVTKGTAPSSVQYGNIYMVDSTKSWGDLYALGRFVTSVNSDSSVVSQIMAYKNEANSNVYGYLRVAYDTANNIYFATIGGSASGTNYSLTRETSSTGVNIIPTMGWVNNPATSTNVVHRSGNETIGGLKTFTEDIVISNDFPMITLKESDTVKGTNPSTEQSWGFLAKDSSNGAEVAGLGSFVTHLKTDGTVWSGMTAYKNVANSTDKASIRVHYPTSGSPYTYAPTPTDTTTTSGTQIATTGWVNSVGNNVVHLAGNETIGGSKTFTSDITIKNDVPAFWLHENDAVKGTNPQQNEEIWSIYNQDNTNNNGPEHRLGLFATHLQTSGTVWTGMTAYKNVANSTDAASIKVYYPISGSPYTYAPNPTDTSSTSSQQIATVGWVNNPSIATNIVHRTGDETVGGVKTFSSQAIFEKANGIQLKGTNHYYTLRSIGNTPEGCALLLDNSSSSIAFNATDNRITIGSTAIPAYAIAPTDTTTTNGTQIATTGWVNSTNNNVVHRSGDETIAGAKTFTSDVSIANDNPYIELHDNDFIKGNLPSSEPVYAIYVQDKTSGTSQANRFGVFTTHIQTSGTVWTGMAAYKNVANSTDSASIRVLYPTSGSPYTYAPNPTDSYSTTSGTQITTTGWVGSNFVNLAGTQTITGEKTFTKGITVHKSDPRVWLENTDAIKGTAPSSDLVSAFQFRDKNGKLLGSIQNQYITNKRLVTQLIAYKASSASDTGSTRMGVGYDADGNIITYAPACDHNESIVTTIGNSKAENGYFKLGNGLIIQWGRVSNTNNNNITLNFPTPFTSTNYSINAMRTSITGGGYSYDGITGVSSRATTSCVLYSWYGSSSYDWLAIGY